MRRAYSKVTTMEDGRWKMEARSSSIFHLRPSIAVLKHRPRGRDHLGSHLIECARNKRPRRTLMPATAKLLRERVRIHAAHRTERNLHLAVPEIAKEQREPHAHHGPRILGDPVQVL